MEDNWSSRAHIPHDSALSVGDMDSAKIIRELEQEVRELTDKVASASQRFADYENEIRVLHAQVRQEKRRNASMDSTAEAAKPAQQDKAGVARGFGSFMHSRKPTAPAVPSGAANPNREKELETALVAEQTQRLAAESEVKKVNAEIEELTGSLFEQANGMVAEERKENARLKERIVFLEQRDAKFALRVQALEQRDRERRGRLERLERAQVRIERAKEVLRPK